MKLSTKELTLVKIHHVLNTYMQHRVALGRPRVSPMQPNICDRNICLPSVKFLSQMLSNSGISLGLAHIKILTPTQKLG